MTPCFTARIEPAAEGGFVTSCVEFPRAKGRGPTEAEAAASLGEDVQRILLMRMEDQALWLREAALQELVNPESIVAWAEERIMELDPPPLWLIDLATLRSSTLLDYASALGFSAGDSFSRPSAAQRAPP